MKMHCHAHIARYAKLFLRYLQKWSLLQIRSLVCKQPLLCYESCNLSEVCHSSYPRRHECHKFVHEILSSFLPQK